MSNCHPLSPLSENENNASRPLIFSDPYCRHGQKIYYQSALLSSSDTLEIFTSASLRYTSDNGLLRVNRWHCLDSHHLPDR